jgi:Transglutaminase-like superfamily
MWLANDFGKLRNRSWLERRLLLEAKLWLTLGRIAIRVLRFQQLAEMLGLVQADAGRTFAPARAELAASIGWAVRTVAGRMPGRATCLAQSLAGAAMLRRRNIPFTISLGVAKDAKGIAAHAWLCSADAILTGAGGRDRFTMISAFSAPSTGAR